LRQQVDRAPLSAAHIQHLNTAGQGLRHTGQWRHLVDEQGVEAQGAALGH
jgi:hypothetical protein